jgi:gliding motility-associated-like protein
VCWNRLYKLLILLSVFNEVFAQQNLIKNHSFEEHTGNCSTSTFYDNIVKYWFTPHPLSTPDYHNECYVPPNGQNVPYASKGFQYANEGKAFVGIAADALNFEYVSILLDNKLEKGKKYCGFFYAVLANNRHMSAINRIGMAISETIPLITGSQRIPLIPQIYYNTLSLLSDTLNWVKIEGEFIATGNEQYVTIGNFYPESQTTYADSVIRAPYYYIDNVWLYECEEDSIPTEPPPASDSSLHYKVPNVISPNGDGLNDAFVLESRGIKEASVKVFNRWGELVQSTKYNVQSPDVLSKTTLWDATHRGQPAPQGVYYYLIELSTKNGEVIIEKGTVTVL